jgi:hypothetical membrane protein
VSVIDPQQPPMPAGDGVTRLDRYLPLTGVVGPPLFVLVFSVAGILRAGYSPARQAVSDLGVGADAWIQNANFLVFGTLVLAFAVAFYRAMRQVMGPAPARVSAILIGLTGVGILASGIFTAAPATEGLHFLAGFLLAFGSAIASIAVAGRRLRHLAGWEGLGSYSRWTAAGALALIALSFAALNPASPLEDAGVGGLVERALAVEVFAWHAVLGWRLYRTAAVGTPPGTPAPAGGCRA